MFKLLDNALATVSPSSRPERRSGFDRREGPTRVWSRYWLVGKRRRGRRAGEAQNIYVDRYSWGELSLVVGVLFLSAFDLVLTLVHLNAGGTEANPFMAFVLEIGGHGGFAWVKAITTVIGLLILLVHVRFRRVKNLLLFAFLVYAGVFVFHIYLSWLRAGQPTI